MTPEERQLLGGLFDRVRENAQGQRDAEAEAFINNAVKAQPYAPYMLAQAVIVQEETLKGAVQKIEELEAKVQELEQRAAAPPQGQPAAGGGFLGGLGRSMFGGSEPPRPAAPAPGPVAHGQMGAVPPAFGRSGSGVPSTGGMQIPPPPGQMGMAAQGMAPQGMGQPGGPQGGAPWQQQQPAPGPWQQPQQGGGGSTFLKGALGAAAGVAGGMLLANAVSGMFRGDSSQGAGAGASAGSLPKGGDNVGSSLDKDSAWGSDAKGGGSDWDNSGKASGDDWSSPAAPAGGSDWDTPGSAAGGDDWDTGGGDDWGGDE